MALGKLNVPVLNREVSRLGMGSMIFCPDARDLVFELLDTFHARGGNLIDAAQVYYGGLSEKAIGMYFGERGNRADWVLIDKGCEQRSNVHRQGIRDAIACNLERVQTDAIDLWMSHRDNPETPVEEIIDTLNEEVQAGRIRAFGGSNWTVKRLREANEYALRNGLIPMAASSPHVCLTTAKEPFWADCTQASDEDVAWYAGQDMVVFAWSSQGRGFFLDSSGSDDSSGDLPRVYHNKANFEKLRRARELAAEKGVEPIQIALAYVLNLPAPIAALVGPASVAEIDSCVAASSLALTPEELDWLALRTA